ncbi:MAG: hypothetical protein LBF68_05445 [Christensenellaceae bacterium]|jgi:hypothetical protein|nr:hypothetical protein [Christensenellaceae bacterium]
MKKLTVASVLLIITVIITVNLTSCSVVISTEEGLQAFDEALKNSLNAELYYIKEKINDDGTDLDYPKKFAEIFVNVYGEYKEVGNDTDIYAPTKDENGKIKDFTIFIKETLGEGSDNAMQKRVHVGKSNSSKKGETLDYIFREIIKTSGKDMDYSLDPMSAYDYFESSEFQENYALSNFFTELLRIKHSDMFFLEKNGAIKNGVGVALKFKISDSYLTEYRQEFGKVSRFSGSKYISVEIINEKISQIIVFRDSKLSNTDVNIEAEPYSLSITYLGPIINMPKYDKSDWYNDSLA